MAKIDENTVSAKGQLKPTQFVSFEGLEQDGLRILFVGNSITRHGVSVHPCDLGMEHIANRIFSGIQKWL